MLADTSISAGDTLEAGGHTGIIRAIYNGEADFRSAFFSPPQTRRRTGLGDWRKYRNPADLIPDCASSEDGSKLMCDGWRVLDARSRPPSGGTGRDPQSPHSDDLA